MRKTSVFLGLCLLAILSKIAAGSEPAAARPDFSGSWALDRERSDDAVARVRAELADSLGKGRKQMLQRYLADALIQRAAAAHEVEIRQTEKDIAIFDAADDLAIYYIDGKKHKRQDQVLGDFETVAAWQGNELVIEAKGRQAGQGTETLLMEGYQLVVWKVWRPKHFKRDIVAKYYYRRIGTDREHTVE